MGKHAKMKKDDKNEVHEKRATMERVKRDQDKTD